MNFRKRRWFKLRFTLFEEKLLLTYEKTPDSFPISAAKMIPDRPINSDYAFNHDLQKRLQGKQLLHDDLPEYPHTEIHEHYENGYVMYRKGINKEKGKSVCVRCGNKKKSLFASFPCARCKEDSCIYCRQCIMMGRVSSCTPLLTWSGPGSAYESDNSPLVWEGSLSDGQKTASSKVEETVLVHAELLVWAVCGAGKTEVLFSGINAALSVGQRVCIATPRTDVVLELAPRLQKVFPAIKVAALYGGSEDRQLHSQLAIATTHQLLRFYHAFDTLILDEVDAFPYSVEETLQHAAVQARKPLSAMIYLTATPNEKWRRECRSGKRNHVTIPARFHRHPLPVPQFSWCGNWEKPLEKNQLPSNVIAWIKTRLENKKQCLLFLPKISKMNKVLPIVQTLDSRILAVHAEDPERKEKVQMMRREEIPMLLTTTILERGVTFPGVDVAVLGSEDRIFTESALVQIAGRVGRSAKEPGGSIIFFHYGQTEAMRKARKQIQSMNKQAAERGLLGHELSPMS